MVETSIDLNFSYYLLDPFGAFIMFLKFVANYQSSIKTSSTVSHTIYINNFKLALGFSFTLKMFGFQPPPVAKRCLASIIPLFLNSATTITCYATIYKDLCSHVCSSLQRDTITTSSILIQSESLLPIFLHFLHS